MVELVEGWTDPITDQLLLDGVATTSLGSATIDCVLYDRNGTLKTSMGTATVVDAATRKVKFTPDSGKLVASESPYSQRWKVTDGSKIYYHPNGAAEKWVVRKP